MTVSHAQLRRDYLEAQVRHHLGQNPDVSNVVVEANDSVPNGYSNITELYSAAWDEAGTRRTGSFVLRACAPGGDLFYQTPLNFQWKMMKYPKNWKRTWNQLSYTRHQTKNNNDLISCSYLYIFYVFILSHNFYQFF